MMAVERPSTSSAGQMVRNVPPVSVPTITSLRLKILLAAGASRGEWSLIMALMLLFSSRKM